MDHARAVVDLCRLAETIYLPDVVANYIARIVDATHEGKAAEGVRFGASPRAAIALAASARSRALLQGRANASFEDVEALAPLVLRHRIIPNFYAESEKVTSDILVDRLIEAVPAPRSGM